MDFSVAPDFSRLLLFVQRPVIKLPRKPLPLVLSGVLFSLIVVPLSSVYSVPASTTIMPIVSKFLLDGGAASPPMASLKPLNDTGIDVSANYPSGHNAGCVNAVNVGNPQDCDQGRDNSHDDDSDGHAGFSFTKISSTGAALPATSGSWHCVKDEISGLTWEVKTDDDGLRDKDDRYTWYSTDSASNGGGVGQADYNGTIFNCNGYDSGDPDTFCNTQAYVARVNAVELCGYNDWRLPVANEIFSITDLSYGHSQASIDPAFFPNTAFIHISDEMKLSQYWTATAYSDTQALTASFAAGSTYRNDRTAYQSVRLVRFDQ